MPLHVDVSQDRVWGRNGHQRVEAYSGTRNTGTYRRNRLGHEKADKLVSLFHNLRLLKRMKKPNYTEPMIAWGDAEEMDVDSSRVTKYELNNSGPSKLLQ